MGPSSESSCLGSEVSVAMEEDTVGGVVDLLSSLWIAAEDCDSPVSWGEEVLISHSVMYIHYMCIHV